MPEARPLRPLTPLQRLCAGVIAEYWIVEGRSPTLDEICHELDLSSRSQAHRLVEYLNRKGWLRPRRRRHRYQLALAIPEFALPPEHEIELTAEGRSVLDGAAAQA